MHMHSHAGHNHGHGDFLDNVGATFIMAVAANLAFAVFEGAYALIAGSAALLADAWHNLADVLGLLLAWGAVYLATRRSTRLYSYGFRKTTILAAVINAALLMLAAGFIAVESVEKVLNPTPVSEIAVMVVAGIGIFVNAGTALLFRKGKGEDLNLRGAYLHLAYDALVSVGVVVSALIMLVTGWLWVDGVAGLLIVAVMALGAWGLLKNGVNLMLDAVPQNINRDEVHDYLGGIKGVSQVHDLHIWALSTNENCLTAHLVMPEDTLWDSETGYASIGRALREKFQIHHVTLQVEKGFDCATQDCD